MSPLPLPCLFSWAWQGDFPWEPSASLPGVFSPAQGLTEGLGSSQEQTCRQQGHPGSSGNDAKAELSCSAFPRGILKLLGVQRREADLTCLISPVGKQLQSLCLGAAPSAIPACNWKWTFPGRSTAALGQLQIISGVTECSVP